MAGRNGPARALLRAYDPEDLVVAARLLEEAAGRRPNAGRATTRHTSPEEEHVIAVSELLERYAPEAILAAAARVRRPDLGVRLGDAYSLYAWAVQQWPELVLSDHERFAAIALGAKMQAVAYELVSVGTTSMTPVEPRRVFGPFMGQPVVGVVVVHGHPSGDPYPSHADRELTVRLSGAGQMLGMPVLDHLVIGGDGRFYSFASEGALE